jgi:hypothetical protein
VWEGNEQEMFRLQDRTALIPFVRNRTLTLIEREDDTRSWKKNSSLFLTLYHNIMPSKGLEIHTYRMLAS